MPAGLEIAERGESRKVVVTGAWTIRTAEPVRNAIESVSVGGADTVTIDLSGLSGMDTAGALLLRHLRDRLAAQGRPVDLSGLDDRHRALVERVLNARAVEPLSAERRRPFLDWLETIGRASHNVYREAAALLFFLGVTTVVAGRCLIRPGRIRFVPVLNHIEKIGFNALPIVGLLSFLIGIVVAYQGADQLRRFGAEIFTVNLLGVSILREMGILLAAIVIAGRSGSAFAAQIGTMKVNQEVDAMQTLGLDPVEILVMPRLIALVISMPLLAVYSDLMGLLGGGLMVVLTLDVSFTQFLERLNEAVTVTTLWLGLVKAPVFGFAIALTGCHEGLKVTGSAESVGHHTTRAVVISIFLVIVADALFSILFSAFGL